MPPSLEVLFDNAADAIIIAEKASGIILDANKSASKLLQLPHEKIVGMHQCKLHPQNDSSSFNKHKKELDKTDLTVPHESKILSSDGSEIPVEILASKIVYDGKHCIMGTFRDISLRKQAEQDLIESEEKFRNLLELAPEAFYHGDSEGNIIAVNEKAIELTKYTREELISMPISKLFSPDTLNENPLRYDLLQLGETITRERKIITKTDNAVSVEMKSMMMPDGRLQCFMSDITERKKAEKNLLQLNDKLIKLNATKDKLFSIIAHDLRSPLNNVLGFSDLLIEKLQTSEIEKAKKYAAVINTSAKDNLNLVENLLTWAKTQIEEIKYTPENIELKLIVEESLKVLNTSASLKKIKLINSISDDIVTSADPDMLQTIMRNLVQNAIKFTDSGGMVEINAVSNPDHIEISVTDNGVGITEENQKKLFGADLNFSMNGTENEGGTGLGLMLCMEFVQKHGGKIWVESQAGKGSKFLFTLPVCIENSR